MKNLQKIPSLMVRIAAMILMVFTLSVAWAQDKGIDINVDVGKKGGNWYNNPIVYVAGAAVFILLLVALLRSGNKSSS